MSGVRSIYRGPSQKGQPTGASAPIRVDDSTSQIKIQSLGAGNTTEVVIADNTTLGQSIPTPFVEGASVANGGAAPSVAGGVATAVTLIKQVPAIANAVATAVLTVTVPNIADGFSIGVTISAFLGAGGAIGAFQETLVAFGLVAGARTPGVACVATAGALSNAADAKVAGSDAAGTLAYAVTAMVGAVGVTQTFTITVTITAGAGAATNHVALVEAVLYNSQANGVTIA